MKVEPSAQQPPLAQNNRIADTTSKTSSRPSSTAQSQTVSHDTVAISSQAERIQGLLSVLTADARPTANDKVEALRNAVESGAYSIDLTGTASKLVDLESDLTNTTRT